MKGLTYIVHVAALVLSVGERTGIIKTASASLHKVAAQRCLVLDVAHLVLVVRLEVVVFALTTN